MLRFYGPLCGYGRRMQRAGEPTLQLTLGADQGVTQYVRERCHTDLKEVAFTAVYGADSTIYL